MVDGSSTILSSFVDTTDAATALEAKVHSLQNNRAYTVNLWAVHEQDGTSGAVATNTFSTLPTATAPEAPFGVTFGTITGGTVDVSWSKPHDTGGLPVNLYSVRCRGT